MPMESKQMGHKYFLMFRTVEITGSKNIKKKKCKGLLAKGLVA